MGTTAAHEYPKGVTLEDVWAVLRENAKQQEERQKKYEKEREERQKKYEKEQEERQKEREKEKKEYEERWQRMERLREDTDRRMGYLSNRFGEVAEYLLAQGIAEKFNNYGYHFNGIARDGYEIRDEKGKIIAEIDILLENGSCIMVVEVKTKPKKQDIDHHIKRLEILRSHYDKRNDKRKIFGAMAGAVFGKEEKDACIETGFYVIEPAGDSLKIDVPKGFIPKDW